MDYIKIRFGNEFDELDSRFEKSVQEMFRSIAPVFWISDQVWRPQMDIYETPTEIYIFAEIAGVNKDNLEIEINTKAVKIHGYREMPRVENGTYRLAEIQYGKFERILYLPYPVDTEQVKASYSEGFLKIHLIKIMRNKVHRIPISDE